MKIKFVKQKHKKGCAIACIAMVTGKTYEEIDCDFLNDFDSKGLKFEDTIRYLANAGYSVIHKEVRFWDDIKFFKDEMLKPFAPVHLVRISQKFDAPSGHLVVMDKDGKIFCPDEETDETIRESYAITDTLGIYK